MRLTEHSALGNAVVTIKLLFSSCPRKSLRFCQWIHPYSQFLSCVNSFEKLRLRTVSQAALYLLRIVRQPDVRAAMGRGWNLNQIPENIPVMNIT
jgi:hypothetical protein